MADGARSFPIQVEQLVKIPKMLAGLSFKVDGAFTIDCDYPGLFGRFGLCGGFLERGRKRKDSGSCFNDSLDPKKFPGQGRHNKTHMDGAGKEGSVKEPGTVERETGRLERGKKFVKDLASSRFFDQDRGIEA
jgi:hypothetical protein